MTTFCRLPVWNRAVLLTSRRNTCISQVNCISLTLAMIAMTIAAPAYGSTITEDVTFSAHSFQVGSGLNPPPVDPVIGEFRISFDPTVAVVNNTADISLISLNIALGSTLAFTYSPVVDGGFAAGTLRVGGINDGADSIQFFPSTNDFWLQITNFATNPAFLQLGYTQTSVSDNNLFYTLNQTGSVVVSPTSSVPEPTSLCLVGLGIASLTVRQLRLKRKSL